MLFEKLELEKDIIRAFFKRIGVGAMLEHDRVSAAKEFERPAATRTRSDRI